MADGYTLTSRFKIPLPEEGNETWLEWITHWGSLMDVMFTALANKDYVISGLAVTTSPSSLSFSYAAGSVSINGVQVDISSGSGTLTASTFNWIYVQGGVLKLALTPPSGVSYVPIACVLTNTGASGSADLRPSPPMINGVSITPFQVNPTGDVNMVTSKRIIHADSNVGSNVVLFGDGEVSPVVNWGNLNTAKDWEDVDLSAKVPAIAKFAILNCYMATYLASYEGWAVLEVKTSDAHTDNIYNFVDYGHLNASVLNGSQLGHANQIMLPINEDTKFKARTLISGLGGLGVYYAYVRLMGYVV